MFCMAILKKSFLEINPKVLKNGLLLKTDRKCTGDSRSSALFPWVARLDGTFLDATGITLRNLPVTVRTMAVASRLPISEMTTMLPPCFAGGFPVPLS